MTQLEIFLTTALKQILDLHDDGGGAVCKCGQCKLARQSLEAAQPSGQGGVTTNTKGTRCADCGSDYIQTGTEFITCAICNSTHRR